MIEKDNGMISDEKRKIVKEILLVPIQCVDDKKSKIEWEGKTILSPQKYWPCKSYEKTLDPDMSDFAIGFYEIIYRDLMRNDQLLQNDGTLKSNMFAGDTINSFQIVANMVPEAGRTKKQRTEISMWPEWLKRHYRTYHCLANFWVVPLEVGRKSDNADYCKMNYDNKVCDFIDRFLMHHRLYIDKFKKRYSKYYETVNTYDVFEQIHFLDKCCVDEKGKIIDFSQHEAKTIVDSMSEMIEKRATYIAESKYAEDLYVYFDSQGIV